MTFLAQVSGFDVFYNYFDWLIIFISWVLEHVQPVLEPAGVFMKDLIDSLAPHFPDDTLVWFTIFAVTVIVAIVVNASRPERSRLVNVREQVEAGLKMNAQERGKLEEELGKQRAREIFELDLGPAPEIDLGPSPDLKADASGTVEGEIELKSALVPEVELNGEHSPGTDTPADKNGTI